MGYAIRITTRAVEVVSGADQSQGIVAAEASGAKVGLRNKWGGGELRARPTSGRMVRQGTGWVLEGASRSPYGSYANTPVTGTFSPPNIQSPYLSSTTLNSMLPPSAPGTPNPSSSNVGLGFPSSTFSGSPAVVHSPPGLGPLQTPSIGSGSIQSTGEPFPYASSNPGTPAFANFPHTPNPTNGDGKGFPVMSPSPRKASAPKKDD
jgi:hypothetical protein